MSTRAEMTASPVPIRFADGFELKMHPLTDRDISELDQWVRMEFIRMARASVPEDADEVTKQRVESVAMRDAMGMTWMSGTGAKLMATVDGLARICLQTCRDSKIKLEDIRSRLFDPANAKEVTVAFKIANPQAKGESNGEKKVTTQAPQRTTTRRGTKGSR